jgi:alpha-tubulin suppressor-like RCC1 family protein
MRILRRHLVPASGNWPSSLFGAVLLISACGGSSDTGPPPPPAVASVSVSGATVAVGGTVPRTATVKDVNGFVVSPAVSWTTDNSAIAQVSAAGVVTGVAAGTTTIRASAGGQSGSATIAVADLAFTSLSSGGAHACALSAGGLYCWGDYSLGATGFLPDPEACFHACATTPRQGVSSPTYLQVSAGGNHSCGLDSGGVVYCWGYNYYGELGAPTTDTCSLLGGQTCSRTPLAVTTGGIKFNFISAGAAHTCALTGAGVAYCWGYDEDGELGASPSSGTCNNLYVCSQTPVTVSGGLTFATLSAGRVHTCGLTPAGVAYCWGGNNTGQLGSAGFGGSNPVAVDGGLTFGSLSSGGGHTCGVTTAGVAYCWGDNSYGQLGDGTTQAQPAPARVAGGLTFLSVSAGWFHTCGVTTANALYCWGNNQYGMLGNGTTSGTGSPFPELVQRGLLFAQVGAGLVYTCARTTSNRVYCWGGNNFGQLGNGAIAAANSSIPVGVAGLP